MTETKLPLHTNKAAAMKREKRKTITAKAQRAIDSGDPQVVVDSLSGKQLRFCEEYLVDMNGAAAVIRAGYNTTNGKQIAHQLMENPAIRIAIDALRMERTSFTDVTKDFVLQKIVKALETAEAKGNLTAVLRASELLARHLGMFIERTEISGPDGDAIRYEKAQEDAADFISSISSLARRSGTE